jgi:hypothetical protein
VPPSTEFHSLTDSITTIESGHGQHHLAAITGSAVPLCYTNATCNDATKAWWGVGVGAAHSLGVAGSSLDNLGLEGFVVQSVQSASASASSSSSSISISGGNASERGSLYGVNHVLRALGVEFYAHDVTTLPASLPTTPPAGLVGRVIPDLEYRQMLEWQCVTSNTDQRYSKFEAHLGLNRGSPSLSSNPDYGGVVEYGPPGFVHTSCTSPSLTLWCAATSNTS